jgi:hypothetical protein
MKICKQEMYVKNTIFLFQKQNYISFEDYTSWGDPIAKYGGDFLVVFYSK